MASVPLDLANHPTHVVLDLGYTRSIGSRAAIKRFQKHALYYGITTEFCRCKNPVVCANSETETCWESCIFHFPTTPPCSTRVDVLETGNVLWTFCSGLDESCVPPKIAWAISSRKETCDLCTIRAKISISQLTHERTWWRWWRWTSCSSIKCYRSWRRRWWASGATIIKKRTDKKKSVILPQNAVFLHRCEEEKDLQSGETHLPHWNKICRNTRVSDQKKSRYWAEIQTVKLFATSSISCLMSEIWGTFTWNTATCPLHSSRRGQLTWTFLERFMTLHQHVVKTCPFWNSTKPRPDRSRVRGLTSWRIWRSYLLGPWINPNWRQNLGFSHYLGWSDITFNSISMLEYLSIRSHFQTSWMDGHLLDESEGDLCRKDFPSSSWHAGILSNA